MLRSVLGALFGLALAVAAWGSIDFFYDIPRDLFAAGLLCAPLFLSGGRRRGKEMGESGLRFFLVAFLSTAGTIVFFPLFSGHLFQPLRISQHLRYLGAFLYAAGYAVRVISTRTLKRQYSFFVTIQEDHQLITTGIYSLIRHPVYLGTLLLVGGLALIFPSWYGFLFLVFYSILLDQRMEKEEQLLLKYFGPVYEEYSLKSYRLIPHIY